MVTPAQIERWMLTQETWVSAAVLCGEFQIADERQLRCIGEVPGLISDFAISHSKKGYRHVKKATTAEWLMFKFSLLRHAISEMRRVRRLASVRHNTFLPTVPMSEKDSGQGILF